MVFESIVRPLVAQKKPWALFFYGFFITIIAVFLGYWIFREQADMVAIFLIVFACVPLMYFSMKIEEKKDTTEMKEPSLLKEHSKVILFFVFLFIGMVVAYTFLYTFLPHEINQYIFKQQRVTISSINNPTGSAYFISNFTRILFNNVKVLTFCILFSFFYGTGAIFIITWNASVISVAIGHLLKAELAKTSALIGFGKLTVYFGSVGFSFSRYFLHGIPEIIAYMIAGLAGGIISAAIISRDFKTKKFEKILFDVTNLIIIALVILVIAALIEAFITFRIF